VVGSVFVKKADYDYIMLEVIDNAANVNAGLNSYRVSFDILNGTFNADFSSGSPINPLYKIEDYGNGWFRLSVGLTKRTDATRTDAKVILVSDNTNSANPTYQGDGVSGTYIYGAQLEALPYSTSYIPTNGAIATRLADSVTGAGDATTFNSTEGVLYFEGSTLASGIDSGYISINDGSATNLVSITFFSNSVITIRIIISGVSTFLSSGVITATDKLKIALKYKLNDYALWVDGVEVDSNSSLGVFAPNTLTRLDFARFTSNKFEGKVRDLRTFDTALTDAELQTLTTI
jgi:hypothetical protein